MRIIAGTLKGRRLATPAFEGLRPTSDKLRETLFNVVRERIEGGTVLDAFAGTGAVGLEAISRGAARVTFVEANARAVALIVENVDRCGVAERCAIIRARFAKASWRLDMAPFSLILLDPPYALAGRTAADANGPRRADRQVRGVQARKRERPGGPLPDGTLEDVLRTADDLLASDGLVVLEHPRRASVPQAAGRLRRRRTLVSGDSALTFYDRHQTSPKAPVLPNETNVGL